MLHLILLFTELENIYLYEGRIRSKFPKESLHQLLHVYCACWWKSVVPMQEHPEWEITNGVVYFQKAKESAPCKEIPSLQLINQTLSYARELERIVWTTKLAVSHDSHLLILHMPRFLVIPLPHLMIIMTFFHTKLLFLVTSGQILWSYLGVFIIMRWLLLHLSCTCLFTITHLRHLLISKWQGRRCLIIPTIWDLD